MVRLHQQNKTLMLSFRAGTAHKRIFQQCKRFCFLWCISELCCYACTKWYYEPNTSAKEPSISALEPYTAAKEPSTFAGISVLRWRRAFTKYKIIFVQRTKTRPIFAQQTAGSWMYKAFWWIYRAYLWACRALLWVFRAFNMYGSFVGI